MPLKFQWKKLPVDAEGNSYNSLEEFQAAELSKLTNISDKDADAIVSQKAGVIEILELTMDARPGARGVPKKRKAKSQPELPEITPPPQPTPQV